jgi:hypothetical protein
LNGQPSRRNPEQFILVGYHASQVALPLFVFGMLGLMAVLASDAEYYVD